jgi:hypothetical protein
MLVLNNTHDPHAAVPLSARLQARRLNMMEDVLRTAPRLLFLVLFAASLNRGCAASHFARWAFSTSYSVTARHIHVHVHVLCTVQSLNFQM